MLNVQKTNRENIQKAYIHSEFQNRTSDWTHSLCLLDSFSNIKCACFQSYVYSEEDNYEYFINDIPNHINAALICATASSNCLF